jgi:hypothetical protein
MKKTLALVSLLMTCSLVANAHDIVSTVGYSKYRLGNNSLTGIELGLLAEFDLTENIAVTAGYYTINANLGSIELEGSGTAIGAKYSAPVSETTQAFVGFDLIQVNITGSVSGLSVSTDGSGNQITAGLTTQITDNLNLFASMAQSRIGGGSNSSSKIGGQFYYDSGSYVGATYSKTSDGNSIGILLGQSF